jgi:hypothetical protein
MVEARRAELLGKITDACAAAGYEDVGEFIDSLWGVKYNTETNKPSTLANEYDFPMGPMMKEIWESGYKFWDCNNPVKLLGFIDPYNGHWSKNYSDLVGKQPDIWGFIYRKYKENEEAGTLLGPKGKPDLFSVPSMTPTQPSTIGDALDSIVRRKVREKGSDTSE